MARKSSGRPAPDDELKAVERTGAHDEPPSSLFSSEAVIDTAEARIEVDPEWEAARLLAPAELRALLEAPAGVGDTAAVESPRGLFGGIPDPEDLPLARPLGSARERAAGDAGRDEPPKGSGERFASVSDPESLPLRSIPLPESDPPMVALDLDTRADQVAEEIRRPLRARPVMRPAPPQRPPPPPLASAPPVPVPTFDISDPPRPEPPEDPAEPSVVLERAEFDREESTRVYDRAAPAVGPVLPRGRLVVVQGDQVGKAWYLNRPLTFMGRGNDNDIVLLDLAASRKHLRLDRHAEGFRVQDLQSGNGTTLNGRRISREELYDGDRIQVGGHVLEFATLGTPRVRPRDAGRATDPAIAVRPVTPPPTTAVPRSWVIVWSLATFLAVFGAMYLTRMLRRDRGRAEVTAVETAQNQLQAAREAMARRAWPQARSALEAAQATGAELPDLTREMARLGLEEKAEFALKLAGVHFDAHRYPQARGALAEVPAESTYAGEARALLLRIATLEQPPAAPESVAPPTAAPATDAPAVQAPPSMPAPPPAQRVAPPTAARVAPTTAAARAPSTRAPRAAPASVAARAPATRAPRAPAREEAPPADEGGTDAFPQATAAYKGRRFSEAVAAFERAARQVSGDKRKQAQAKAQAVQTVADALAQADAAEAGGRKGEAAAALEKALAADRTLGGALASSLQPALARHLVYEALRDFVARKYVEAARKNHRALAFDPRLSQAKDLARKLEVQATLLLERARDAEGDERRRLAEQARQLVPANSTLARDAADLIKGD